MSFEIHLSYKWVMDTSVSYPWLQVHECVCEDDVEHSVGSAALFIHVGGCHGSWFIPLWHQRFDILSEMQTRHFKTSFFQQNDGKMREIAFLFSNQTL